MAKERTAFLIHFDKLDIIEALDTDAQRGQLFLAIMRYAKCGELTDNMDPMVRVAFSAFKHLIDIDAEKYRIKSERMRQNRLGKTNHKDSNQLLSVDNSDNKSEAITIPQPIPQPIPLPKPLPILPKGNSSSSNTAAAADRLLKLDATLSELAVCYEQNIGAISRSVFDKIQAWTAELPAELIKAAIAEAAESNQRRWSYVDSILRRCRDSNILTAEAFRSEKENHRLRGSTGRQNATDVFLEIAGGTT